MNLFFMLFLILTILFFIPIPFKFILYYSCEDYYIKFYNFNIISKKKVESKKKKAKDLNNSHSNNKNLNIPKKENKFSLKDFENIDYKFLINKLYHSKFKPMLRINMNLEYSLSDAAKTAIFYGIFNNLQPIIYILCNIIFKTKKLTFNITPTFKDEFLLKFETSSIIFLSIANIIYMMVINFKYIFKVKVVTPNK